MKRPLTDFSESALIGGKANTWRGQVLVQHNIVIIEERLTENHCLCAVGHEARYAEDARVRV